MWGDCDMSASVFHKQVDDSCTLVLCLSLSVLGFQMKRKRGILHHTQVKQNEYMEYEPIYIYIYIYIDNFQFHHKCVLSTSGGRKLVHVFRVRYYEMLCNNNVVYVSQNSL